MLIVSLPPVHHETLLRDMIAHRGVSAVRYNTGMDSPYSPEETIAQIVAQSGFYKKPLYVDLKGKQLRIEEWATPPYGPIVLNHPIVVKLPAKVFFRGDDCCELKNVVDGRKIYVDPLPRYPVGRGQAVNILAERIDVEGDLTDNDRAYIRAARACGVTRFMLSFVESLEYIGAFESAYHECGGEQKRARGYELVLKIESQAGLQFLRTTKASVLRKYRLMAARDDLMIQIGSVKMPEALALIIGKDPRAICASRLLLGLEQAGAVTMADISDLRLMQLWGYKGFMFSDGISRNHFGRAMEFWEEYVSLYQA